MNPLIQLKTTPAILVALACFGLASLVHGQLDPPPDGGYPGFNTAEGQGALYHAELKALEQKLEKISASNLPDFAPELFKSVEAKARALRSVVEKQDRVPEPELRAAQQELETFQTLAKQTRDSIGKAYDFRNASLRLNFIRAHNPALLSRAEKTYDEALKLAGKANFEQARQRANQAATQYQALIRGAKEQTKRQTAGVLRGHQKAVALDIDALNANPNNPEDLGAIESVSERVRIGRPGFDRFGDGILDSPAYYPPPPTSPGPKPPVVGIAKRTKNSIDLALADRSDNETGNRVLRTTDLSTWQVVAELPAIPKLTFRNYTDGNLQPDTRYCYKIESFNAEGARQSNSSCTYTRDANNISVWQLQLRVKVANFADAGSDAPLRIQIGDTGQYEAVDTHLDYSHDDLERNSDFTYFLNVGHISELSDITNLAISNVSGDEPDHIFIEEINLLVNGHEIFGRHFGVTSSSALRIGSHGIGHDELRSNPSWQAFVNSSLNDNTFNQPPISVASDGRFQIRIPPGEVVQRIEMLAGHARSSSYYNRARFKWGHFSGPAVEVTQKSTNAIHVDLDMEATINNWPNPDLDIDFDVELTKGCNNAEHKLMVDLSSQNFTSNVDYSLWGEILSSGVLTIAEKVINSLAGNSSDPIEGEHLEFRLPQNIDCDSLEARFDPDASLVICCFEGFP
jgi:hypothetical protein